MLVEFIVQVGKQKSQFSHINRFLLAARHSDKYNTSLNKTINIYDYIFKPFTISQLKVSQYFLQNSTLFTFPCISSIFLFIMLFLTFLIGDIPLCCINTVL